MFMMEWYSFVNDYCGFNFSLVNDDNSLKIGL